jgi:hypothetical protein
VLFSFHIEVATGVFGRLVAHCLAVLAFLRATYACPCVPVHSNRAVSLLLAATFTNAEGSLEKSTQKGQASMEPSIVSHCARWSCLLRVLSYRSTEVLADACGASEYEWHGWAA